MCDYGTAHALYPCIFGIIIEYGCKRGQTNHMLQQSLYKPWHILGIIWEDWLERGQTNHIVQQSPFLLLLFDSIPIQRRLFAHWPTFLVWLCERY